MVCFDQLEQRLAPAISWVPISDGLPTVGGQIDIPSQNNPITGASQVALPHPTNADILYVATVNGGVWKTTNATATNPTWTTTFDQMPSLSMGALTFDVADATRNTLWAGNGLWSSFAQEGGARAGIYRSTDAGASWTNMTGGGTLTGKNISGMAVNGNTIVVSADRDQTTGIAGGGIYRSTDGGATFSKVSGNLPTGGPAYDLVQDPVSPNVLYTNVAFAHLFTGSSGIYRSADMGATWTKVSSAAMDAHVASGQSVSNIELAVGRSGEVYSAFLVRGALAGLYRSPNGTTGWTQLDTPATNENGTNIGISPRRGGKGAGDTDNDGNIDLPEANAIAGGQGSIHFSIVADPTNSNIVYVGGDRQPGPPDGASFPNSIGASSYSGRLFRVNAAAASGSQAVTLTHLRGTSTINNTAPHADSRDMAFDANGNIIEVDDGGVYRRNNPRGLGDWVGLAGSMRSLEFHSLQYDATSNFVVGGTQDNGTQFQTSAAGAMEVYFGGDGGVVAIDDSSPTASTRYISFQFLGSFSRVTVNAAGVDTAFAVASFAVTGGAAAPVPQFYSPVEINSVQPTQLAFGMANGIYVSPDRGDTLQLIAGGPNNAQTIAFGGVSGGVLNPDVLYVGSSQGVHVRTTAGGALTQSTSFPGTTVRDIVLDPTDWRIAYAVTTTNVYRTADAGGSWTTITGNLVPSRIRTVEFLTGDFANAVVVGDNVGVYRTFTDALGTWDEFGPNLPNVPVMDLDFHNGDRVLTAGTLGRGAWRIDSNSVTNRNRDPVIGPLSFGPIPELSATGTPVGTVVGSDPDGDSLTYSITAGNTGGAFAIDPVSGAITVATSSALNFETSPTFSLTVTVTDSGLPSLSASATVTVSLSNVNEPPTGVTLTPSSVNEGIPVGAVVGLLTGLDPDAGDTFTFALTDGLNARDNARFEIVGNELRMREVLNFEATPIAFIMVRVTDAGGRSFDATLQISVNNVNEAPTNILLSTATIRENALSVPTFVGTFSAVDEDFNQTYTYSRVLGTGDTNNTDFEIITGGQLRATRTFNFETEPTRSIRVRVTDNGSPAQSFEKVFTITVTNINEAPAAPTLSNNTVVEGVVNIPVGTLSAVDPEGSSGLTFSLVSGVPDNSFFVIEGNVLKVGVAPLDFEAAATRTVRVLVFDGLNSNTADLVINVLNVDDTATVISLANSTLFENAGANALVGALSTTGGTGPYTYTLVSSGTPGDGSQDNSLFDVSGTNLVARNSFNFETKNEFFVRVRSTPSVGSPVERAFRITVQNVNEAPTDIQLSGTTIPENADANFGVATLSATDADAGSDFTFSLPAGVDNNDEFTLVGTGFNNLRTTRSYDFETVTSRTITLRVTDNGSPARSFDKQVVLQITNRNEPPTAINFATGGTVFENQPGALVGTITTNDPDVGETFTYRLFPRDLVLNPDLKDDSYLFQVVGNQVFVGPTRLDYEAIQPDLLDGNKRNLTIWVRATDSGGNPIEKPVKITVLNLNDRPQEVGLTGGTVTENVLTANRLVGLFASTDADGVGSYTYQLVTGDGSADNAFFLISGDQLRTSVVFNYEARQAYSIRVRTTDSGGLSAERVFTIRVIDVDELPTALAFSGVTVPENRSAGTLAGVLAATDPEGGPITFTLTPPSAADSNALFRIEGNIVRTTGPLDFERARTHTIRVQATDASGQSIVRDFVVNVSDESNPTRFFRAYNRRGEYHFYTTSQAEFEAVLRNPGFRDETTSQSGFNVISDPTTGASPIYRIFNFQTQRHYYTTNAAERDFLLGLVTPSNPLYGQIGWRYEKDEGLIFANQAPGTVPIYRLYNRPTGVHLYTESAAVRDAVLRQFPGIWEAHGILGYAYPVVVTAPTAVPATAAATSEPVVSQAVSSVTTLVGPAFSSTSGSSTSTTTSGTASRLETLVQSSAVHAAPVAAAATEAVNDEEADPLPVSVATPASTSALDDLFASPSSLVGLPGLGD